MNRVERLRLAVERGDKTKAENILAAMPAYEKDLIIACPNEECESGEGKACKGLEGKTTHIGRRLARLLQGIR